MGIELRMKDASGAILFDTVTDSFTQTRSDQPLALWESRGEGWLAILDSPLPAPGVTALKFPLITKLRNINAHVIHYDILGLVYWCLCRVEEIGRDDLDSHGRFPAASSHAFKHGYLDRPVVDEWLHILGQVIQRQWPHTLLRSHQFRMMVSHDVDRPSRFGFEPWRVIPRIMAGAAIKRGDVNSFFAAPIIKLLTRRKLLSWDSFNTFDWLMDVSDEYNLRSSFYFICGGSDPLRDADYDLEHPAIRDLLRRIHERGHEIGLHPSYSTYRDSGALKRESLRLKSVCTQEGIQQYRWGGRMHYLRVAYPETLIALAEAGLDYDSTLGYADFPGFRCGTCHEYQAFDPKSQKKIDIKIRPLIVMECSVFSKVYAGLPTEKAMDTMMAMKDRCIAVGGQFTLLWHNSSFGSEADHYVYRALLTNTKVTKVNVQSEGLEHD